MRARENALKATCHRHLIDDNFYYHPRALRKPPVNIFKALSDIVYKGASRFHATGMEMLTQRTDL